MRRILLGMLIVIVWAKVATPQALTGEKAEADWIKQYDSEEIAQTNIDGSAPGKAEIEAGLQPGVFKMHSMKQDGHRFRVYDNGNVAVVTYHALGVLERNGKVTPRESNFSDVWVKQNGAWLRVLHAEREISKPAAASAR